jgi:hypothetical protein
MRAAIQALALLAAAGAGRAEIIDRVAVVVGERVIAESEMLLQMRVAAFLNAAPVKLDAAGKRQAAERLIAQTLIRREMELSRAAAPHLPEADALLATLRQEPRLGGEEKFAAELARYEIGEEEVRQQLLWQLTLLRFVEYRFRPAGEKAGSERLLDQALERWLKQARAQTLIRFREEVFK